MEALRTLGLFTILAVLFFGLMSFVDWRYRVIKDEHRRQILEATAYREAHMMFPRAMCHYDGPGDRPIKQGPTQASVP